MEILRSISLPSKLDQQLKALAFHKGISLQGLISLLLNEGVENNRELLDKMAPGLLPKKDAP